MDRCDCRRSSGAAGGWPFAVSRSGSDRTGAVGGGIASRWRKGNYVMPVKGIMPCISPEAVCCHALLHLCGGISRKLQTELDSMPGYDIIIFTYQTAHVPATRPSAEAPEPSPPWHAEPTVRVGYSSLVSRQRLL